MVTKTLEKTTKTARKPRGAAKKPVADKTAGEAVVVAKTEHAPKAEHKVPAGKGRYIFATGRRKTAVANVRMFEGKGSTVLNKLPIEKYFTYSFFMEEIGKP